MIGIILALLYALFLLSRNEGWPIIYKRSTRFLYRWYIVAAVMLTVIFGVTAFTLGASVVSLLPWAGLALELVGGSMAAALFLFYVFVGYVLEILGARLIHSSMVLATANSPVRWDPVKFSLGTIALIIGVVFLPVLS